MRRIFQTSFWGTFILLLTFTGGSYAADLRESLVAWWPLDGNAVDASDNGNDGQLYGPVPCEDRFGNPSGAMCFDGDLAQYIDIGNQVKPPFPFTITAWVKPDTIDGSHRIIRNDLGT
jgi:hypothetical protein